MSGRFEKLANTIFLKIQEFQLRAEKSFGILNWVSDKNFCFMNPGQVF